MQCKNHPKKEASAVCVECGKPVCSDCDFVLLRKRYCKECATEYIRGVDTALKLETPETVVCDICGRSRAAGELFYVCESCGAVACPAHSFAEEGLCQSCYDLRLAGEVDDLSKRGLTRPCPYCGTENKLDAVKCRERSCEKPLPHLKDADEIRRREFPCGNHPGKPAYVRCISCGKYLCLDCQTTHKEANYCESCLYEKKAQEKVTRLKRIRTIAIVTVSSIGAIIIGCLGLSLAGNISEQRKEERRIADKYAVAEANLRAGRYEAALISFGELGDYEDARVKADAAKVKLVSAEAAAGESSAEKGDFASAADHFLKAAEYDPAYDTRYRETRVKSDLVIADDDINTAKTLISEVSISNAAEWGDDVYKLNEARDKNEGAIKRLNEAKEMAPDNAEIVALLAAAEVERGRLNDKSEKIEERRDEIRLAEERRIEAERRAEEARERRAAEKAREEAENYTVYVTNTGSKYHSAGCRYLRKSRIPIKVKAARASGYSP